MAIRPYLLAVSLLCAALGGDVADGGEPAAAAAGKSFKLTNCLVSLIHDIEVPAKRAGVLSALGVREGSRVKAGDILGAIDQAQAEIQLEVARAEYETAVARAASALEIEAAEALYRSASMEYAASVDANRISPRSYSVVQLDKLQLAVKDGQLKIGTAKLEQSIEVIAERASAASLKLAEKEVADRAVVAPIEGEVVEVLRHKDEWVEIGRPILRIVQLDRLRVEGFVKYSEHAPGDVAGRDVRAVATTAGGAKRSFPGKVTFVNPMLQHGGQYRIWAEVENTDLVLRPGVEVELEVMGAP